MAYELKLPDIGEGLTEAEIVRWAVAEGASVAVNETLVEVETDKAVVEIPSPRAGVLLHQGGPEGAVIRVGDLLAVVGVSGEVWGEAQLQPEPPADSTTDGGSQAEAPVPGAQVRAMPIVRRLARELGVDLTTVVGSGLAGKITREDVKRAAPAHQPVVEVAGEESALSADFEGETLSAMRRTIARNLSQSWGEIPHVTVWRPVDATRLLAASRESGASLDALLVKVVLPVLAEFSDFNATFDGKVLRHSDGANIGVAIDTEAGLMVPVVRNAETMNLRELTDEINRLSSGATQRTLGLGELSGGTFTVSNVGAVGGGFGTPIIPYGTTAIVSIGRAEDDVIVRNKAIAIAPVFPVSLSFDHRVIDGAVASRFLRMYTDLIEGYGLAG